MTVGAVGVHLDAFLRSESANLGQIFRYGVDASTGARYHQSGIQSSNSSQQLHGFLFFKFPLFSASLMLKTDRVPCLTELEGWPSASFCVITAFCP